ncbi:succinyl-diaminopimelate desuccinylase [Segniliparus rugosus]|uniref:Succinyl-diaminopimelate desuccinylase n=1 Tax=Segniliparus rugosus (strain ATCC BAA-974 / DSM 45345 / CCUG 50838 / CIP 108380 / JCM 13579 / CDC 945) TaxID=679197 RepID=E5XPK7_SEGRC|nr:succinyl-diaminopimelate desuccinylase [Segniliparus rugosus]EFV13722.2 succinyl-diaminopimelate desuccinylase [Segniliparus rugosus ATCC BAA-974]
MTLRLNSDPVELTQALVDVPSESGQEAALADAVEEALREQTSGFAIERRGNCVLARTNAGRSRRVLLAGHLDTVPSAGNLPARRFVDPEHGPALAGLGTVDMKSGCAVFLHVAATIADLGPDLTLIFYDNEEVAADRNGLGHLARDVPQWLEADVAILGEPTAGLIEAGCQGTLRARVATSGRRAHSARSWLGDDAIHRLAPVLAILSEHQAREVDIDGCVYREGLSATRIGGGVAGNVIPDEAWVEVNFRFAPDRDVDQAVAYVRGLFDQLPQTRFEVVDAAPGALPGLAHPAAAELVEAASGKFRAKYGWTDVSRFAALGIPSVNFGPGDPNLAHTKEEWAPESQIHEVADVLSRYLAAPGV